MAKSESWLQKLFHGILSNAIYGIIVMIAVTLFARYGSVWTIPILYGLIAGLLVFCILLAWKATRRLPPSEDRVTMNNIEAKVLDWLHRSNLGVKNDPNDKTFFRFIVTTDGDRKIIVGRPKESFPDYIHFRADIISKNEDKDRLLKLSPFDKERLMLNLKLELSRACIGYSGLGEDGVTIFKKIPISHSLREDAVINGIWEMEAMINLIFVVVGKFFQKYLPDAQNILEDK